MKKYTKNSTQNGIFSLPNTIKGSPGRMIRLSVTATNAQFDDYNAFVEQIKAMNIDRVIQIYTDAYERYKNR